MTTNVIMFMEWGLPVISLCANFHL